jgi:hypothetical protein
MLVFDAPQIITELERITEAMPTSYSSRRLPLPQASVLADLYSVANDLEVATELCGQALAMNRSKAADALVLEALVSSALIRYMRCFSQSPRRGLKHEDVGRRSKRLRELHAYYKNLRDKYVAHAVNPFEETWVTAMAAVRDGVPQPIAALAHSSHRMLLSAGEAECIKLLATEAARVVARRVKPEYKKVLRFVQKLPLEQVYDYELPMPAGFKRSDVSRTRAQTRSNPSIERTLVLR